MEQEKKYVTMSLSQMNEVPIKLFLIKCVQYQDYQTKKALERIDYKSIGWSDSTALQMFDTAVSYIKYGTLNKNFTNSMKKMVDEIIASNRYRALIPAKGDARKIIAKKPKSNTEVSVSRKTSVSPVIANPIKAIQQFLYAVSSNNLFYTFKTESEMNSFVQGVKFANPSADVKVQKISILED